MSAERLSQVLLPWALVGVMMTMGLNLTKIDFAKTCHHIRRRVAAGLAGARGGNLKHVQLSRPGDLALPVNLTAIAVVLAPWEPTTLRPPTLCGCLR
ncbi:hypothetical protein [Vreelandella boliviensis]|uniref:hypothetical protein n=1 Tax=Vreelandella boliviensis TaxID=223527 RepID=UPI001FCB7530|nr:hypothetical protein [Halomonas boliviensis]